MVQAEHVRFDRGDGKKDCYWRLPNAKDYGLKGRKEERLPLYGSEHAANWPENVPFVVVAEGEPPTDALLAACLPAVGTITGAGTTPGPEALEILRGHRVVLWVDNDKAGREHMERLAAALQGNAAEVRIFEWTQAPKKGDAADTRRPCMPSRVHSPVDPIVLSFLCPYPNRTCFGRNTSLPEIPITRPLPHHRTYTLGVHKRCMLVLIRLDVDFSAACAG